MHTRVLTVSLLFALPLCAQESTTKSTTPLAPGLSFADPQTIASPKDFLRDFPSRTGDHAVNAVVEIPTGTNEKWEVKLDGVMRWDLKDGKVRIVKYLGYPGNYGIVPRAILGKEVGGDGDPLDIVVLGPSQPRGTVYPVRIVGVIRLIDEGEKDDKVLAVPVDGPLADVQDLADLDQKRPGITLILKTWFENYKGAGKLQCGGFGDRAEAEKLLAVCEKSFADNEPKKAQPPK